MDQLEDLLRQCTVKLSISDQSGWGTGFFVAPGLILTCGHVVSKFHNYPIQVQWQNREGWAQAIVERVVPKPYDLALLRVVHSTDDNLPCVYLGEEVQSRDPLYLFGYPDQDFPNGCPVTFNCEGLTGDDPPLIKFALGQVRPGMSGSPLLNQRTGKVCGIVLFTRDRSSDLGGGAIPIHVVTEQFQQLWKLQREFHQRDQRWSDLRKIKKYEFHPFSNKSKKKVKQTSSPNPRDEYLKLLEKKVKGLLDASTHNVKFIDLGLEKSLYATIPPPWVYRSTETTQIFTRFSDAFKTFERRVLLLGSPGSGKTITLLYAAKGLIEEAKDNPYAPIPVLINLSKITKRFTASTTQDRFFIGKEQQIEEWLIQITAESYPRTISEKIVRTWFNQNKVALLLDGLDEVGAGINNKFDDEQLKCLVLDLNRYLENLPDRVPVVICSRIVEYRPLQDQEETKLRLNGAVELQPLTREQIDSYLSVAQASELQEVIAGDTAFAEMVRVPLILSMVVLAYEGLTVDQIRSNLSLAERRYELFQAYIDQMILRNLRRERGSSFDSEIFIDLTNYRKQVDRYLGWLAVQMSQRMQTIFPLNYLYSFLLLRRENHLETYLLQAIKLANTSIITLSLLLFNLLLMPIPISLKTVGEAFLSSLVLGGTYFLTYRWHFFWSDHGIDELNLVDSLVSLIGGGL